MASSLRCVCSAADFHSAAAYWAGADCGTVDPAGASDNFLPAAGRQIRPKRALAKDWRHDKRRFSWRSHNVIGMMLRMIAVYSRQYLQKPARYLYW
jgi:hypothetical protein